MPPKPSSTPKNVASKGTTPQEGHSKTRVSQGSARKDVTAGQSNKTLAAAALRMKPSEELLAKSTGDETAITVYVPLHTSTPLEYDGTCSHLL